MVAFVRAQYLSMNYFPQKYCNDLHDIFKRAPFPGTLLSYGDFKEKVFALVNMCEEGLDMCLLTLFCQRKIGLSYTTDRNGNKSNRIHLIKIPCMFTVLSDTPRIILK